MSSLKQVETFAEALVHASDVHRELDRDFPMTVAWGQPTYCAAFLARSLALLDGVVALARTPDRAGFGAVVRTLVETAFAGMYAIAGGDRAIEALMRSDGAHLQMLNEKFEGFDLPTWDVGDLPPGSSVEHPTSADRIGPTNLFARCRETLEAAGAHDVVFFLDQLWTEVYSVESHEGTHATMTAILGGFAFNFDGETTVDIPEVADARAWAYVRLSVLVVLSIARLLYLASGRRIDRIEALMLQAGGVYVRP